MTMQDLINELVSGYVQSKYDKDYLKERIQKILEFILPRIKAAVKNEKERELIKLWNIVKEDEETKNFFREIVEKVERPIVIYVASKFENNQYFGAKIIEEALKCN